jgi:hypothetical protein
MQVSSNGFGLRVFVYGNNCDSGNCDVGLAPHFALEKESY